MHPWHPAGENLFRAAHQLSTPECNLLGPAKSLSTHLHISCHWGKHWMAIGWAWISILQSSGIAQCQWGRWDLSDPWVFFCAVSSAQVIQHYLRYPTILSGGGMVWHETRVVLTCQSILGTLFIHLCSWIPLPAQSQISMVLASAKQLFPSSDRRSEWCRSSSTWMPEMRGLPLGDISSLEAAFPFQQSHPARLWHVVRGPEPLPSETWQWLNRAQGHLSLSLAVRGPPHEIGTWNCVADSQPFCITDMTQKRFSKQWQCFLSGAFGWKI